MGLKINDAVAVTRDIDSLYLNEVGIVRNIYDDGAAVEFGPRSGQALNERYYWRGFYDQWGVMPICKIDEPLNFKVGDRVRVSDTYQGRLIDIGEVGTIINIMCYACLILGVEFDNDINGHGCHKSYPYQGKDGRCLWLYPSSLEIIETMRWTETEMQFMEEFY